MKSVKEPVIPEQVLRHLGQLHSKQTVCEKLCMLFVSGHTAERAPVASFLYVIERCLSFEHVNTRSTVAEQASRKFQGSIPEPLAAAPHSVVVNIEGQVRKESKPSLPLSVPLEFGQ